MRSALLIIDVQVGLFRTEPLPHAAAEVITRLNDVAARARAAGVPVIFIQHEREHTALARGEPGWALDPRLAVMAGDRIVAKTTPDSFHQTELAPLLARLGVDHLVIGGYASEFCVDTTTRRAAALGYAITLIADGHTTQDKPHLSGAAIVAHHNATLSQITSFGVPIRAERAETVTFTHN